MRREYFSICLKRGLKTLRTKQITIYGMKNLRGLRAILEKYFIDSAIFCEMSKRFSVLINTVCSRKDDYSKANFRESIKWMLLVVLNTLTNKESQ